ncbi:MAG: arsenic resistance protein [Candidatus Diapherotrites archaeon]|nr:arsenic resistance protein [Candidatus Diapherotrites archaeon]
MINDFFVFCKKNSLALVLAGIFFGLINLFFFNGIELSKDFTSFFVMAFLLFPSMLDLKFSKIFEKITNLNIVFFSLFLNFIVSGLIAVIIAFLFLKDFPDFFMGFLLFVFIPTSSMTVAWTALSKGGVNTAFILVPVNMLFSAFIAIPLIFPLISSSVVSVDAFMISKSVLFVFFIPLLIAVITRRLVIKSCCESIFENNLKKQINGFSSLALGVFSFFAVSNSANTIIFSSPESLLFVLISVALFYFIELFISFNGIKKIISMKFVSAREGIALFFASSSKQLALAMAVMISSFSLQQAAPMLLITLIAFVFQATLNAYYAEKVKKELN